MARRPARRRRTIRSPSFRRAMRRRAPALLTYSAHPTARQQNAASTSRCRWPRARMRTRTTRSSKSETASPASAEGRTASRPHTNTSSPTGRPGGRDTVALPRVQPAHAVRECLVPLVDLRQHGDRGVGHGFDDIIVEHDLGPCELLPRAANIPPGDLAGPGHEVRAFLEVVEFFADDEAGLLKEVLRISTVRHQRAEVAEDLPLMP